MSLTLASIHWTGEDVVTDDDTEEHAFRVSIFGKDVKGRTACIHVHYCPFFYVEVGLTLSSVNLNRFFEDMRRALGKTLRAEFITGKCLVARSFVGTRDPTGFLKLTFRSVRALRKASNWLFANKAHLKQYEVRADPIVRLMQERNVFEPCCCDVGSNAVRLRVDIDMQDPDYCYANNKETTCSVEYTVLPGAISQPQSQGNDNIADNGTTTNLHGGGGVVVVASFDIECFSLTGDFPDPRVKENVIIAICTTFSRLGDDSGNDGSSICYRKVALALGNVTRQEEDEDAASASIELECFSNEAALLARWADLVEEEGTDALAGYNIWGFDMRYIYQRVIINGGVLNPVLVNFYNQLSRVADSPMHLVDGKVKGGGAQVVDTTTIRTDGVLQIDLMYYLKRYHPRLESYKLDAVSRALLGGNDDDGKTCLSIKRMQDIWKHGSPSDKWIIMRYCVQDALLVSRLLKKLTVLNNVFEMANVCGVPPSTVLLQGEQAKVYSLIMREARAAGMLCPTPLPRWASERLLIDRKNDEFGEDDESSDHLQGATVLEPREGAYWNPIVCLDFQSLYPSIMMAHNLCHSTLVTPESTAAAEAVSSGKVLDVEGAFSGARFLDSGARCGILPKLLRDLQEKRNDAKAAMTRPEIPSYMRAVFNAKQQAYKVSMNSVYGFCGVNTQGGLLPCLEVASSVTAIGRGMILRTKEYVEMHYPNAVVIYGDTDSVMIDFNSSDISRCETLGREVAENVTRIFERPIKLCFDKCYHPYLLFCKKRYVGRIAPLVSLNTENNRGELDCKGVQFVRRDTCPFVKRVCNEVMEHLLFKMDIESAIGCAREAARSLFDIGRRNVGDSSELHTILIDDLVVTKSIRFSARNILNDVEKRCAQCGGGSEAMAATCVESLDGARLTCRVCGHEREVSYRCTTSPAIQVACKMEKMHPGSGPKAGDSVPFVYVIAPEDEREDMGKTTKKRKRLCSEMAHDPEYAKKRGYIPDGRFYYEHQLKNVMIEIFALVMRKEGEDRTNLDKKDVEMKVFGDVVNQFESLYNRQPLISSFLLSRTEDNNN
jgi:DNA polymerase delta subunit 1